MTVCVAGGGSPAGAQGDLAQRLKARYERNLVVLRGFPTGTRLRYDDTGTPIGLPAPGIWTVDGRIQIDRLQLRGGTLRLDASRVLQDRQDGSGRPVCIDSGGPTGRTSDHVC